MLEKWFKSRSLQWRGDRVAKIDRGPVLNAFNFRKSSRQVPGRRATIEKDYRECRPNHCYLQPVVYFDAFPIIESDDTTSKGRVMIKCRDAAAEYISK